MFDVVDDSAWLAGSGVASDLIRQRTKRIRLKLAINLFKRYLLGAAHVADQPQVDQMLDTALGSRLFELIDSRTWESWFEQTSPLPKRRTIQALDCVAQEGIRVVYATGDAEFGLAPGFFVELVYGGLLSVMAKAARSKRVKATLGEVVAEYMPLSAWHLHMDAMEVSGLAEGLGNLHWTYAKKLAAKHLMSLLYLLWGPREGLIYRMFASNLRLQWNAASAEGREQLRGSLAMFPISYFNSRMTDAPQPMWSDIGIEADLAEVHIHKALLAMAGDFDFLKAERKHAWAFDLASAALLMHALAWTDRYQTFGFRLGSEQICWWTLSTMFFALHDVDWDARNVKATMNHLRIPWSEQLHQALRDGRASYVDEIHDLGLDVASLVAVARHATDVHQLVYRG